MRDTIIWPVLLAALLLSGCTETDDGAVNTTTLDDFQSSGLRLAPNQLPDADTARLIPSHHDFSFAEYKDYISSKENTIIAPFDTQIFLTMLALGAEGSTLNAFSDVTHFNLDQISVYGDVSVWEQKVSGLAAIERNRYLWGQSSYLFNSDYLLQQAELFGPTFNAMDFRADSYQALLDISETFSIGYYSWIDSRTRVVAMQSTAINAGWSSSLLTEELVARFGTDFKQNWVDMIRLDGILNAHQGQNYKAVQIPFEDDALSLLIITPDEGQFYEVSESLNTIFWNKVIENLEPIETRVYVPKFFIERDLDEEDLTSLGIALSDTAADFKSVNNAGYLYLKQPQQHISMTVDNSGVSSIVENIAALRAMENESESLFVDNGIIIIGDIDPDSFFTDTFNGLCFDPPQQSPFIFALMDNRTNTILQIGQVVYIDGDEVIPDWYVPYTEVCDYKPPVEVYKYKGSLQCEVNSGEWFGDMRYQLSDSGIEVLSAREAYDNLLYPTVCGAADGVINVFGISETQLNEAQALGFNPLSALPQ